MKKAFNITTIVLGIASLGFGTNPAAIFIRYWWSKKYLKPTGETKDGVILAVKAFAIHIAVSFVIGLILIALFPELANIL